MYVFWAPVTNNSRPFAYPSYVSLIYFNSGRLVAFYILAPLLINNYNEIDDLLWIKISFPIEPI